MMRIAFNERQLYTQHNAALHKKPSPQQWSSCTSVGCIVCGSSCEHRCMCMSGRVLPIDSTNSPG